MIVGKRLLHNKAHVTPSANKCLPATEHKNWSLAGQKLWDLSGMAAKDLEIGNLYGNLWLYTKLLN